MGEKIGSPAATVSHIENAQRALKEPKIASWAAALGVDPADLYELWVLCQGLVPAGRGRPVFYNERPDVLGSVALDDDKILKTLRKHPELEPIYQLAARICAVMNRLLPGKEFGVQPRKFEDPIPTDLDEGKHNGAAWEDFVPLPVIWVHWHDPDAPEPVDAVTVPLLKKPTRIVRRRATSVLTADLEDLIRTLSGPERERVRGYIEAVVEERSLRASETGENTEETKMSAHGTPTCGWCGTKGHDRRSCTVPQSSGECSVCHYHGHDRRNCPHK